jgi:hypothetical protein
MGLYLETSQSGMKLIRWKVTEKENIELTSYIN